MKKNLFMLMVVLGFYFILPSSVAAFSLQVNDVSVSNIVVDSNNNLQSFKIKFRIPG